MRLALAARDAGLRTDEESNLRSWLIRQPGPLRPRSRRSEQPSASHGVNGKPDQHPVSELCFGFMLRLVPGLGRRTDLQSRRRPLVALAIVCGLSAVGGCGGSSDLDVLLSDPVAKVELSSAVLARRVERSSGETFGKPNSAVVQLAFVPSGRATFQDVLDEAVQLSEQRGWVLEQRSPWSYRGTKSSDGGNVTLDVFFASEAQEVIVQLTT